MTAAGQVRKSINWRIQDKIYSLDKVMAAPISAVVYSMQYGEQVNLVNGNSLSLHVMNAIRLHDQEWWR